MFSFTEQSVRADRYFAVEFIAHRPIEIVHIQWTVVDDRRRLVGPEDPHGIGFGFRTAGQFETIVKNVEGMENNCVRFLNPIFIAGPVASIFHRTRRTKNLLDGQRTEFLLVKDGGIEDDQDGRRESGAPILSLFDHFDLGQQLIVVKDLKKEKRRVDRDRR